MQVVGGGVRAAHQLLPNAKHERICRNMAMEKVAEMSRSFQMVSMVPTQERRSRRGTSRVGESVIDRTASYYPQANRARRTQEDETPRRTSIG